MHKVAVGQLVCLDSKVYRVLGHKDRVAIIGLPKHFRQLHLVVQNKAYDIMLLAMRYTRIKSLCTFRLFGKPVRVVPIDELAKVPLVKRVLFEE